MPFSTPVDGADQASTMRITGQSTSRTASALLLVALTVAAYLPALSAGFVWDDDSYVTANATLRSLDGLRRIWFEPGAVPQYYPLTFSSFWVEYHLWGLQPLPYHLVNVLLHGMNAVLLWLVLRRMRLPAAWIAAALFALHPMSVESVAWVTERKNVLSGLFALGALLVYLRGEAAEAATGGGRIAWRHYLTACALFVGALLSKTVTCSLPAVLLVIVWWQRGTIARHTRWKLTPLFAVGIVMAAVTIGMERDHVGAEGPEWTLSVVERMLVAGRILWFYPRTLLWPHGLAFIYPRWTIDSHAWWQYLFPAAAVAVTAILYAARRRIGTGPVAGTLCYAAALTPALGFFDVYPMRYSFVADHFAYLPMIPLLALIAAGGARVAARAGLAGHRVAYALCATGLLALALLTAQRCAVYHDLRTLWVDTLEKNSDCWLAHNNLGVMVAADGDTDTASMHYRSALSLKPDYREAMLNLGNALLAQGKLDEGMARYAEAVRLDPGSASAHSNLAMALIKQGNTADALIQLQQALRLNPNYPEVHVNLGSVWREQGRLAEAIAEFTEALRLQPDSAEAHYNLAGALAAEGHNADALVHFAEVVRLQPSQPEFHLAFGNALRAQARLADAIVEYGEAMRLQPASPEIHNSLGAALAAYGQSEAAIAQFAQALQLKTDFAEAHFNWGTVLIGVRRFEEAEAHLRAALHLHPGYADAYNNLGYVLFEEGQTADAIAAYGQALRLRPDYPEAHTNLAMALAKMGRDADAIAHFEAALRVKPDHALAQRGLALALARDGPRLRAISELQAALQVAPGDEELRQQLERLLQSAP